MPEPLILPIRGRAPQLHEESWVAPNASVIGQVTLAARASVWYGATLRAEAEPIEIGFGTNIQDGVTIHVDSEFPVSIGAGVSVGHNAVLHGCVVEDDALIGMGAVILNGARVGNLRANAALVRRTLMDPRQGRLFKAIIAAATCDQRTAEALSTFYDRRVTEWSGCVVDAVARGKAPEGTDAAAAIRQVSAPLYYQFLTSTRPLTVKDAERAVDATIAVIATGVFVCGKRR